MLRKSERPSGIARTIICAQLALGSIVIAAVPATGIAFAQEPAGQSITKDEIAQRLKFDQLAMHWDPSREDVIAELREEKRKLRIAQRSRINVTDHDVDTAYATMAKRMNLTPEQLTGALAHAGIDAATLKQRIRADIAWRQIVRSGIPILNGSPPLHEQRDTTPFSKGLDDDPPPRRKTDQEPTWRE